MSNQLFKIILRSKKENYRVGLNKKVVYNLEGMVKKFVYDWHLSGDIIFTLKK